MSPVPWLAPSVVVAAACSIGDTGTLMDTDFLTSNDKLNAAPSSFAVFILGGLVLGILFTVAITLVYWHRQRAALARASVHPTARLTVGHAMIQGKVEVLEGAPYAVRIRIWQRGREYKTKNGWGHAWTETKREVLANPFYVLTRSGERVRVEPDRDVFLVDALDKAEPLGSDERIISATLTAGETVVANGILVRAADPHGEPMSYRSSSGVGWVLKPSQAESMLLSAEPLEGRYVRRAAFHRRWAEGLGLSLLIVNTLLFGNYHLSSVFGDVVQATVDSTRTWTTRNKNTTTHHYSVVARYKDSDGTSRKLEDDIRAEAYTQLNEKAESGAARTLPFRVVSFWPDRHQVGTRPTLSSVAGFLALVLNVVVLLGYGLSARSTLPWYDKRRVAHSGHGRLFPENLEG